MISAIAEGIYALGAERNPNTVKLNSYAPSLQNRNWYNWTPDMISYEADPSKTVLSTSYWQQLLFAHYRGTETLPVVNTQGDFNPLYWQSSIEDNGSLYLKVRLHLLNLASSHPLQHHNSPASNPKGAKTAYTS